MFGTPDLIFPVIQSFPNSQQYLDFLSPAKNKILSPIIVIQTEPSTQIFIISNYIFNIICMGGLKKNNEVMYSMHVHLSKLAMNQVHIDGEPYRYYSIKAKAIKHKLY